MDMRIPTAPRSGLAAIIIVSALFGASAVAQVREESAEEFNRRAQAEQDAYMRQWQAEQDALRTQQAAPKDEAASNLNPPDGEVSEALNADSPSDQTAPAGQEQDALQQAAIEQDVGGSDRNFAADASATADNSAGNILFIALILVGLAIYLAPTIIAFSRGHRFRWPILAFNIGAGWSGIGWVWTLVWSVWPSNSAIADPLVVDAAGVERR